MSSWDWRNPDYLPVWHERAERLAWLRNHPADMVAAKAFYTLEPWHFINDWGVTVDPRNIEVGRADLMPFILFPRQVDFLQWVIQRWRARESGVCPKSRDMGISWLCITLGCTMCIFNEGMNIGFGSRKEMFVDDPTPDSIFYKGRMFMQNLPRDFAPSWTLKNAPFMRIEFPDTRAVISGEAGDNIGRGGRKSWYLVDEAAHIERPQLVDASLSANTNCRIDVSSVRGSANPFAVKCRTWDSRRVFVFHWRESPLKDQKYYDDFLATWGPVVTAQELDIDFNASVEGVVIPAEWVTMCVNAHLKIEMSQDAPNIVAYDVADEGQDKCALIWGKGSLVRLARQWSGKQSDMYVSAETAVLFCDEVGTDQLLYDGDGVGANVRGDVKMINRNRLAQRIGGPVITQAFRGSFAGDQLYNPDHPIRKGVKVTNRQFFENYKAQSWWDLRLRFENTVNALRGREFEPGFFISLCDGYKDFAQLCMELSQPVFRTSKNGKMMVDKAPDVKESSTSVVKSAVRSPNMADGVMMRYAPRRMPMLINNQLLGDSK